MIVAECQAIRAASRRLRELDASIRILVNDDAGETYGTKAVADVVEFYNTRRWLSFDLVTGKVDAHHPMWEHVALTRELEYALEELADDPEYPDLLGLDHYITSDRFLDDRTDLYPPEIERRRAIPHFVDVEVARVHGLEVDGFYRSLKQTWERYGIPMALTEVHIGGEPGGRGRLVGRSVATGRLGRRRRDDRRGRHELGRGRRSRLEQPPLPRGGLVPSGMLRRPVRAAVRTPLGDAVAATAAGRPIDGLAPGWWREPDRVLPVPAPDIAA